jgi:hypothetical protein
MVRAGLVRRNRVRRHRYFIVAFPILAEFSIFGQAYCAAFGMAL